MTGLRTSSITVYTYPSGRVAVSVVDTQHTAGGRRANLLDVYYPANAEEAYALLDTLVLDALAASSLPAVPGFGVEADVVGEDVTAGAE